MYSSEIKITKSKQLSVFNYILVEKIDLVLLVKTWLRENDGDSIWKKASVFIKWEF